MVAFVVRFSNLLFCDIWSSFSTLMIVTVIVCCVPSIKVSMLFWITTILSRHIILKEHQMSICLHVCKRTACFNGMFFVSATLLE